MMEAVQRGVARAAVVVAVVVTVSATVLLYPPPVISAFIPGICALDPNLCDVTANNDSTEEVSENGQQSFQTTKVTAAPFTTVTTPVNAHPGAPVTTMTTRVNTVSETPDAETSSILSADPNSLTITAEPSAEQQLHCYADKHVNETDLYKVLELVGAIVASLDTGREENTTVLQDLENVVRNAETGLRHKNEEQKQVAVAIERTDGNVVSVITFRKNTNRSENNKPWVIDYPSDNVSDEHLADADNDVAVRYPPVGASVSLSTIVYDEAETLFREKSTQSGMLNSAVANMNVDGKGGAEVKLPYAEVVFKRKLIPSVCEKDMCAYWKHNQTDGGQWAMEGCNVVAVVGDKTFCNCSHLTHFGSLIVLEPLQLGPADELALDIVTYAGCAASLAGVTMIACAAARSRSWRRDVGHKLVLCLAVNVALVTAVFLPVAAGVAGSGDTCVAVGALLHYLLLASFSWTLVSAWLQYRRYVVGIYMPMTHLVLKMSLFSWGLPLLPVVTLLSVNPGTYHNRNARCHPRTFCFPSGSGFHATVTGPVGFVVCANLFIFVRILQTLHGCGRQVHRFGGGRNSTRVFFMVVFEFFLLGLPWAFGLLSGLHIVFLYLFCLTATNHGFILFLFFVVFKKKESAKKHSDVSVGLGCTSELRLRNLPSEDERRPLKN